MQSTCTFKDDKLSVEIRLQNQGDTFDWIVGGYYEDSTDTWFAPFNIPTNGGTVRDPYGADALYSQSMALNYYEWYFGEDLSNTTESWSSGQENCGIFGRLDNAQFRDIRSATVRVCILKRSLHKKNKGESYESTTDQDLIGVAGAGHLGYGCCG